MIRNSSPPEPNSVLQDFPFRPDPSNREKESAPDNKSQTDETGNVWMGRSEQHEPEEPQEEPHSIANNK